MGIFPSMDCKPHPRVTKVIGLWQNIYSPEHVHRARLNNIFTYLSSLFSPVHAGGVWMTFNIRSCLNPTHEFVLKRKTSNIWHFEPSGMDCKLLSNQIYALPLFHHLFCVNLNSQFHYRGPCYVGPLQYLRKSGIHCRWLLISGTFTWISYLF